MHNDSADHWSHLDKRDAPELGALLQAEAALPSDFSDPLTSASTFLAALADPVCHRDILSLLVHPRSAPAWGDFTAASRHLASIKQWGMGSIADRADGNAEVAYVKILNHVANSFQVLSDQAVQVAALLTMVWSNSRGMWLVFGFGEPIEPARIPPLH